ncbi:unnamed protein product (mitochondrion) [Plasmodiophora brassicae]|uniref:UBA domain-containing protein n=1 Tax=Plasmodiophora brassicae TaxID=37360 RepID=A0A0G4IXJ1_PLABS|nr:hypothetical protein PBRA_007568 [Plasmodiophora brassicae]SPR02076.1 unnamed protein product [Plasmodiophora brassicae]
MAFFTKDTSFVNRIVFPAPRPPTYTAASFPTELVWMPDPGDRARGGVAPAVLLRWPASEFLVLFFHGNGEDLGGAVVFLRDLMNALSNTVRISVLAVEYPGYGIYKGVANESGALRAAEAAFSFATRELSWPVSNLILLGVSIGTGPAVHLASQFDAGGLVLLAAYESVRSVAKHLVGTLASYLISDRFVNHRHIREVRCPAIFIHGTQDEMIPCDQSVRLFERCPSENKQIVLAEGVGHNGFDLIDDIVVPLQSFFNRIRAQRSAIGAVVQCPDLCSPLSLSVISSWFASPTPTKAARKWRSGCLPIRPEMGEGPSCESDGEPPFSVVQRFGDGPIVVDDRHFDLSSEDVGRLCHMGFSRPDAEFALQETGGNLESALDILLIQSAMS